MSLWLLTCKCSNISTIANVSSWQYSRMSRMICSFWSAFFNLRHEAGYQRFLEVYVDGDSPDTKFSSIAGQLHNWRNILAHQWLGSLGHEIIYDYQSGLGWKKHEQVITINPKIYCSLYLDAFGPEGKIYDYAERFTDDELQAIKQCILEKYIKH